MNAVIRVEPLSNCRVRLTFADGQAGEVDLLRFTNSSFFKELLNPDYFSKVRIFFQGIGWPNGQDLSPDTLLAELEKNQSPVTEY